MDLKGRLDKYTGQSFIKIFTGFNKEYLDTSRGFINQVRKFYTDPLQMKNDMT